MDTRMNVKQVRHAVSVNSVRELGCPNCGKKECSHFIAPAKDNPIQAYMYQCAACEEVFVGFAEGTTGPNPSFIGPAGRLVLGEHPFKIRNKAPYREECLA